MVVENIPSETDVLIIGAGPGGYVAAIRAGQLDLNVTLVEKDTCGGVCLNRGCIPSKALIHATDVAHEADHAEEMGVYADPVVDLDELVTWKDGVVDQLTGGVEQLCKANGVTIIEGQAEFSGKNEARIAFDDRARDAKTLKFEHAVIATGSRPIEIPNFSFDGKRILSSEHALSLESVPESLLVVGAGYIGMELSTVFAKLGSEVTVIEMLDSVLPGYEDDIGRVVREHAEELGIDFHFGQSAKDWEDLGEIVRVMAEDEDGNKREFDAERVLVAAGREPVTDTLNLDTVGLQPDGNGFLKTDDQARTDTDHVFAIGDVAGEPMLAHKASKEGEVVAEVLAGEPAGLDYQAIPTAVFTEPEIGTVGMTCEEAKEAGFNPVTGKFPFQASGRALTVGESEGFVRLVADADSGFVHGAQIVGPKAAELSAELGLAIEMGARLEDVAATIHTHPTLSEAVMEAAKSANGKEIHTINR
jgi:dihydrolipoamide dehydrogenase